MDGWMDVWDEIMKVKDRDEGDIRRADEVSTTQRDNVRHAPITVRNKCNL
jgi:hypothetical protein